MAGRSPSPALTFSQAHTNGHLVGVCLNPNHFWRTEPLGPGLWAQLYPRLAVGPCWAGPEVRDLLQWEVPTLVFSELKALPFPLAQGPGECTLPLPRLTVGTRDP